MDILEGSGLQENIGMCSTNQVCVVAVAGDLLLPGKSPLEAHRVGGGRFREVHGGRVHC